MLIGEGAQMREKGSRCPRGEEGQVPMGEGPSTRETRKVADALIIHYIPPSPTGSTILILYYDDV